MGSNLVLLEDRREKNAKQTSLSSHGGSFVHLWTPRFICCLPRGLSSKTETGRSLGFLIIHWTRWSTNLAVSSFKYSALVKIITYQAGIFIQTHKTTEANIIFTYPLGHWTSISTCPRAKFTCPRKQDLGFFLPCQLSVLCAYCRPFFCWNGSCLLPPSPYPQGM